MQGQTGLRVLQFLLFETGTYNVQYRRPYETNLTGNTLNEMKERLSTAKAFTPTLFSGMASHFVAPSPTPENPIDMVNGWNEPRVRFMLELEYNWHTGGVVKEIVLGYSSHLGVSHAGAIDPQMVFYVNSVTQARASMVNVPGIGTQMHQSIFDSSHILVNNSFSNAYSGNLDHRLRPEDVYCTMQASHLQDMGESVLDSRTMNYNIPVKSRRTNSSVTNYVSSILKNYIQSISKNDFGQGPNELLEDARGSVVEESTSRDPFLMNLSQVRQNGGVENTFSFGDLARLDPNVQRPEVTKVRFMSPTAKAKSHQTGLTAEWNGVNKETEIATILSHSVPALMMELGIMKVFFKTTNRDITNNINTVVYSPPLSFSDVDMSVPTQMFLTHLENRILRDVSFNGGMDFAIDMRVDLMGETWISLSVYGRPFIEFVTPSFADALLVPVLTADQHRAASLASDFENLANELSDVKRDHHPGIMSAGGWTPSGI